ncbi:MAG: glycyl-radical enzyme activating protein [Dehalococcoidales bacterium]|nr:MAG: glycyl-radical enzyme activating protein [Dehalococcoidales bacterium]
MLSESATGEWLVLSISRMTIHNGPGLRTVIYLKGCPLRCLWCSTPESQKTGSEIAIYPNKCIHCDLCISVCPLDAITVTDEVVSIDRSVCNNCGRCVEVCYSEAIELLGQSMTIKELVDEVTKDSAFYKRSGGGVVISGGEPLINPNYIMKLLQELKKEGINIGIDTCGYVPWTNIEKALPYIDFFLWDIKHMNAEKHRELTGVSNELILSNARAVSENNIPLYIRIPVIPGCNDSEENIRATCEFAQDLSSVVEIHLVPLHHLGKGRYDSLDRPYPINDIPLIPDNVLENLKKLVESYGLQCVIQA